MSFTPEDITNRIREISAKLSPLQLRFVAAMESCKQKNEAAIAIGIRPQTVYQWHERKLIDELIELIALDVVESAKQIRKRNLVKAMAIKSAALDSDDEKIAQAAATEIIEWELGKAKQAMDLTSDGEKIVVTLKAQEE